MRFLLYNIRYATGGIGGGSMTGYLRSTREHLPEIIEFIRSVDPDVAGLIEVDAGSYRTRRKNQAEEIGRALGHYHAYRSKYHARSVTRWIPVMRRLGNAFLTRDSLSSPRFHYFRKGIKRLVIELELEQVNFFLVHLALGGRVRHAQLADLYDLVRTSKKPVIVAGDFNTLWGGHEIRLFKAASGLRSADEANRPTYPSWKPKRHLDFILCSERVRITRFELPSVTLSDHLPLVMDFEIEPAGI